MKGRLTVFLLLLAGAFGGLAARLVYLQVERHGHYAELAERQQQRVVELIPPRGTIYDAAGRELAVSAPADSVYAVPREIEDPEATARALAGVLHLDAAPLAERLSGRGWFAWVKRQLDPDEARAVEALGLPGIRLKTESKRYYPQGELAAQVLGFVGTDFHGLAGLEQSFDDEVTGERARRVVLRDAGGRLAVDPDLGWVEAEPGADLHLTLDRTLQHLAERELARSVLTFRARAGTVVLLDPRDGAVRAMASYPPFDPNRFGAYPDAGERWRNRAVADAFEPGSTFKMVTAAAALEANLIDPSDVLDCGMGRIVVHGMTIRDHKPFGLLTFREVIAKSSNVGAIKVGLRLGDERLFRQIEAMGFGRRTGIELPGENPGLLRPLAEWSAVTKAYVAFGQGIAVTPLQLAAAFGAVANGGSLVRPYLVRSMGVRSMGVRSMGVRRIGTPEAGLRDLHPEPVVVGRVMSESTARQVERLLEAVVLEGTGKQAAVEGFPVAGKTGTAQMADGRGRGYSATDHMAVFAGFVPARDPELVGVVVIDRARTDYHGGSVAAPVFGAIAGQALLVLGKVPQRDPLERWPGERPRGEAVALAAVGVPAAGAAGGSGGPAAGDAIVAAATAPGGGR